MTTLHRHRARVMGQDTIHHVVQPELVEPAYPTRSRAYIDAVWTLAVMFCAFVWAGIFLAVFG